MTGTYNHIWPGHLSDEHSDGVEVAYFLSATGFAVYTKMQASVCLKLFMPNSATTSLIGYAVKKLRH